MLITRRRSRRGRCIFKHQLHASAEAATPPGAEGAEVSPGPEPQITYLLQPPTPGAHGRRGGDQQQAPPPLTAGRRDSELEPEEEEEEESGRTSHLLL